MSAALAAFDYANPLLEITYVGGQSGDIRRCDIIEPPVPSPLNIGQSVTVMYNGIPYEATAAKASGYS